MRPASKDIFRWVNNGCVPNLKFWIDRDWFDSFRSPFGVQCVTLLEHTIERDTRTA